MIIGRWSGQGTGTFVEPFVIDMPVEFNPEEPFYIRMDSNLPAFASEESFFRFNGTSTRYLLAIVIKDTSTSVVYQSKNAIAYTMLLTSRVDYTDGAFIINVYDGISYILKQQIFNSKDLITIDQPKFVTADNEPYDRKTGDFWFDLTLLEGQIDPGAVDESVDFGTTVVQPSEADFILEDETIVVDETVSFEEENYDEYGNFIIEQY